MLNLLVAAKYVELVGLFPSLDSPLLCHS